MMAARALAEALPDFGPASRHREPADPVPVFEPTTRSEPPPPEGPSVEERIAAAEEALRERLQTEHAEAMETARAEHDARAAALEARLGGELGALVATAFTGAEDRLVEVTGAAAARILGMTLGEDLEKRAVDALARTIREAVGDGDGVRIVVLGAAHMQEALRTALGGRVDHLEFHESDGLDLAVEIDDKVFETRLSEWSAALAGILA